MNIFPNDSLLKKADDKCRLKFGAERVKKKKKKKKKKTTEKISKEFKPE